MTLGIEVITAIATVALAAVGVISFRSSSHFSRETINVGIKWERVRFTNAQILDMVSQQMTDAFNRIAPGPATKNRELAAAMLTKEKIQIPLDERPPEVRAYHEAVGVYDNLLDRIAAYAEADLIDEDLFFSQYDETIVAIYFILKDYVWESELNLRPRVTRLATRAFLHYSDNDNAWMGDDYIAFYARKARELYPGQQTERRITRLQNRRNEMFLKYG